MDLISLDKQKIEFNRISTEKMFNDIEKTVEQMLRNTISGLKCLLNGCDCWK